MWLTGFDAPSVSTLYLDKPMKDHTLMQTIARANRVFPGKENGIIVNHLDVLKYLKRALADYASDEEGLVPVKDIERLFEQLIESIGITVAYCSELGVELNSIITETDTFKNILLFEKYANIIVGNDDTRNEYKVLANIVENLYESLRPDIFKMEFDASLKEAILYLRDFIEGQIRPDKLEAAKEKINALLDQSVITSDEALPFTIDEDGKELDLSKLDIEELREQFNKTSFKNSAIADLREHIESKLQQMLRRNVTRSNFAERFQHIIDEYNAGGSMNDDFYEKLMKFMEDLRAEEERHVKEDLTEEELEIYDLLLKEKLTQAEETRVKLAAKALYRTLTEKRKELFIVDWAKDPAPRERVRSEIQTILNDNLPESYDREIFSEKSTLVFEHIVDQAITGYGWAA
jgi:type I restriction enzyme R subunit